jgi:hypothetical protein
MNHCFDHSGCLADIENLKKSDRDQWDSMTLMREKVDGITVRLNVILGTLVVSLILAIIGVSIKK